MASGFVREHLRPLVGSAGLHLVLLALFVAAALRWTTTQPPVQLAIEGVVVDAKDLPKSARSGKPSTAPKPKPTPAAQPPPAPAEATQVKERAAEAAARKAADDKARAEQEQALREADAAEHRKQQQLEAQRKEAAADEARRKAEAEAERKRAAEEAARQKQEAAARAAQDAKAKAAREADLQRRMAAEEAEGAAMARAGVVDEYRAILVQAIERNWNRPPSARAGLSCTLYVTQATGGTVTDVKLGTCNGDGAVRESIVNAVYKSSPLPAPRDPRAFERRLEIVFEPKE
ncbi:MAG TPA: cell envelope integrity protein TolA [Steroidobacteraceae bacterium]|nr:cell envelope integrity protein TolA [Steroidobacteraceae bacterium]